MPRDETARLAPEPNSREAGTRFEDEVAETFEREKRPTLRRVDRFGTDTLHDVDGRDLGDLDVIALPRSGDCSLGRRRMAVEALRLARGWIVVDNHRDISSPVKLHSAWRRT